MDGQSRLNQFRIVKSGPNVERIVLPTIVKLLTRKQHRTKKHWIEGALAHTFSKHDMTFQVELSQRRENARIVENDQSE